MTKIENPNGIPKVETNTLTIPGKPATVMPEIPAQEIKLPCFLQDQGGFNSYRIDAMEKYLRVSLGEYHCGIAYNQFDSIVTQFTQSPEKFTVITEQEFMDKFSTALNQISNTAYGANIPDPDDFDDTDYSSAADEDLERRTEQWLEEMESNELNPREYE